jgi:type II secretion system protein H
MAGAVKRRGFTLVEVLVVMVIVAIAFAALRPGFVGSIRTAKERAGLRRLVGLLKSARTEAIARGKLVRVMCDAELGEFWAEVQVDPTVDRSEFAPLALLGRSAVRLPESLSVSEFAVGGRTAAGLLDTALYYYPDGRTDGARVVLSRARGGRISAEVVAATGRVQLRE